VKRVKSSSLDSDSNVENRQMIALAPFYGVKQNSAYSFAETIKTGFQSWFLFADYSNINH